MGNKKLNFYKNLKGKLAARIGYHLNRTEPYTQLISRIFYFNTKDCYNTYGFSYKTDNDSNPFINVLKEYEAEPSISPEDSALMRHYLDYRPRNLGEAILGSKIESLPQDLLYISYPQCSNVFMVNDMPMPWSTYRHIKIYKQLLRKESSKVKNPVNSHFYRSIETYLSIKKNGFLPAFHSDRSLKNAFIRGVLLKKNDQIRFIITAGRHRAAALSVLNWACIPVIIDTRFIEITDLANIDNWPVVKEGIYSPESARKIFEVFF